jgi:hypothetical protein
MALGIDPNLRGRVRKDYARVKDLTAVKSARAGAAQDGLNRECRLRRSTRTLA